MNTRNCFLSYFHIGIKQGGTFKIINGVCPDSCLCTEFKDRWVVCKMEFSHAPLHGFLLLALLTTVILCCTKDV